MLYLVCIFLCKGAKYREGSEFMNANKRTVKFGEMLKKARKSSKLNQSQLAEKLNISQNVISQYESGERFPSFDVLVSLPDLLNISLDDLVFGSEVPVDILKEMAERKANEIAKKEIEQTMEEYELIDENGNALSRDEVEEAIAFIKARRYMSRRAGDINS